MIFRAVKLVSVVVVILFVLIGCIRSSKEWVLIATDGYLHTPNGKYRFKTGDDSLRSRIDGISSSVEQDIYAEDDSVLVKLAPLSRDGFLQIFSLSENKNIHVALFNSHFRIDDSEDREIPFVGKTAPVSSRIAPSLAFVDSQRTYRKYFARRISDEFNSGQKIGTKVHYHVPFKIGDNDYLIDVGTKYRYSRWPEFYAPGLSQP